MSEPKRITLHDIAVIITIVGLVLGVILKFGPFESTATQPGSANAAPPIPHSRTS